MTTVKMTQKELRKHLAMSLSECGYDRERFGRAVEEKLDAIKWLGDVSDKVVKWTTPGVWTRFLDKTFTEYTMWREVYVRREEAKLS